MRKLVLLLLLIGSFSASGQTYTYIGVKDGLSNRQVHSIRKDRIGYMWFLTHEGIDRYDGKEFRYYKLTDGEEDIYSQLHLNWLQIDSSGNLWEVGKKAVFFITIRFATGSNLSTSFRRNNWNMRSLTAFWIKKM